MAGFERAARAYHLVHSGRGKDYADEARQIEAIVRQFVPQARSLLDVACGGGGHLAHLAASFETVVGVELSPHMIDEAHRVHPDLELHQGDMRSFRLARRFDAVVCLFSSVAYMTTPVDLHRAVATMAGHLASPGVLLVEGWLTPDAWTPGGLVSSDCGADDDIAAARVVRSRADGPVSVLEMDWLIASRAGVERVAEEHRLRMYEAGDYRDALAAAGLAIGDATGLTGRGLYVGLRGETRGG